jgi:hypothetical protein
MKPSCAACKHYKPVHYSRTEVRDPRCTHPELTMFGQLFDGAPYARFYLTHREARSQGNDCGPNASLWSYRSHASQTPHTAGELPEPTETRPDLHLEPEPFTRSSYHVATRAHTAQNYDSHRIEQALRRIARGQR